MKRRLTRAVLAFTSVSLIAAAGHAQPAATTATKKGAPDPGEVVCKDIDVSGVRFATKRVCATRAE